MFPWPPFLDCPSFAVFLPPADHAADGSGGGKQPPDQHRRGSHLPEVPPELLHPEPALPPRTGGLDSGLQPRPKGELGGRWRCSDVSKEGRAFSQISSGSLGLQRLRARWINVRSSYRREF